MRLLLPLALLFLGARAAPVPVPAVKFPTVAVVARIAPIPPRPKVDDFMRRDRDGPGARDAPSDAIVPARVVESESEATVHLRGCRLFLCL
ncbi:hypothetical protein C8R46DRAFT_1205810 [Mycena filopes]|nr:hypothetical protein C8R46DRAFT_1205810 [Mycena filopes]